MPALLLSGSLPRKRLFVNLVLSLAENQECSLLLSLQHVLHNHSVQLLSCSLTKEFGLARKELYSAAEEFGQAAEESCRLAKEFWSAKLLCGRLRKEFCLAELLCCRVQLLSGRAKLLGKRAVLFPYPFAHLFRDLRKLPNIR
ncbi:hypothetical protein [Candidatus Electronema sp. PJ]|uniref:hypothetical protein n=1 Tax=Candidatus Electronema sp. PJ TaxID=3401572 RepID=UPI003AA8A354